jgi:hypothetical protein
MSSGRRSRGGVSEQDSRRDQTHEGGAADGGGAARMTSVNVPEGMNELTHRTGGSVDTATAADSGPYRKSWFKSPSGGT